MNKTIWTCWFQGWDSAPDLCVRCLDSWKHYNPDWKIIELDENNYRDYADIDSVLPGVETNRTAFSDILRLFLLNEYGGVWADSTLFCNKPLDDWLSIEDTFVFTRDDIKIASWFIGATDDSYVISKWKSHLVEYWKEVISGYDRMNGYYSWVHKLYEECYNGDKVFRDIVNRYDHIDCYPHPVARGKGPHMFTPYDRHLNENLTLEVKNRIDAKIDPAYKLTYKQPLVSGNTSLNYLFSTIEQ